MKSTGLTGQIGTLSKVLFGALVITMASVILYCACSPDPESPGPSGNSSLSLLRVNGVKANIGIGKTNWAEVEAGSVDIAYTKPGAKVKVTAVSDDSGATVRFAKLDPGSALPIFGTDSSFDLADGDYLGVEVTAKNKTNKTYYKILIKMPPSMDIFLCFGQSNMEGYIPNNSEIPAEDKQNVSDRFQVLAAVDMSAPERTQGKWYTAAPPLCREDTGLTPADYFGRAMVEGISDPNVKVGVVVVAVAGCAINLFEKDTSVSSSYLNAQADWMKNIAAQYDDNPYQRLVDMAKIAQESGIIRGILLHQGESGKAGTNGVNGSDNANWAAAVKRIYDNLLEDLGLDADSVPLLAGQVVGNSSSTINNLINNLPNTMPGVAHVISSQGLTAAGSSGNDALHFSYEGYRELGRRYAAKMLELLGYAQ